MMVSSDDLRQGSFVLLHVENAIFPPEGVEHFA